MNQSLKLFTVATLAGALAACGGSGSSSDDTGSTGTVSFDVTDAPAMEFSNVTVSFTGISLKPQNGEWVEFSFDTPKTWNLLDLQGGMSEPLITDEEVPAGPYSELRLLVDTTELASFVTLKDQPDVKKSLAVPSGEQSGLKLKGEFLVAADTTTDFTIDFDVKKSIVNPQGQSLADYLLKPSLRLVSNLEVGSISGEVDYATINQARNSDETQANCTEGYEGSAYVYQGADVIPTDLNVNNEEGNPLMVVPVSLKDGDSLYSYKAAFLTEGEYTISYSCQVDDNEIDDEIEFDGTQNVTVEAGIETEAQTIPLVN
ncbi:DUF4382 domain-containing protein [Marinobacter confluentis]|uniref:DUF4382 domain-containing protein n=2 Tax=Marinobacter confluentis TaxID=1697557 RepID=A0A4Z1C0M7_9GAMM|nr:DUF4382 domain-containing protein [Marinobacter confluentis]TGN38378.1 DUF4382 domain-containing protein [Marinobacter confluentis]